jgi:hypothetical protein
VLKAPIPSATAGVESIVVTAASNAALKLYKVTGARWWPRVPPPSDGSYTFTDLVPVTGAYYVTQNDGSGESVNSSFVNPSLRTPVATPGTESVDVSNVSSLATIKLYRRTAPWSPAAQHQGGGVPLQQCAALDLGFT